MAMIERLFSLKHNRWFGVHNPLGSDLGKAEDPHLSMVKLAELSFSGVLDVRYQAARNLAERLHLPQSPADLKIMTTGFNRSVVVEALKNVVSIDLGCKLFISDFISSMKAVELSALLAGDPNKLVFEVAADAAAHPSTPVPALLELLEHQYAVRTEGVGEIIGYSKPAKTELIHHESTQIMSAQSDCRMYEESPSYDDLVTIEPASGPIYKQYKYRFPVRRIAAQNLRERINTMDNETAMKVRLALQGAVLEESR